MHTTVREVNEIGEGHREMNEENKSVYFILKFWNAWNGS